MKKKCLKMLSLTSELLFYTCDCLKLSLKNIVIICQKMTTFSYNDSGD